MSERHTVMKTAIFSGGLLVQQIMVFLTGVLIARSLGAVDFGILGTLRSLTAFLLIVTPLGLDLSLLKHAAFYEDRPGELRLLFLTLRGLVWAINLALIIIVAIWIGPWLQDDIYKIDHFSYYCIISMLGLAFAADIQVYGALYRVADRITTYAILVNYSQPVVRLLLTFLALALGGGIISVMVVNSGMFAATSLAVSYAGRIAGPRPATTMRELRSRVSHILSESIWMALTLLVGQTMRFVDVIMLAAFTSPQVTAAYVAMSSVAQLIQIYPSAIAQTMGPLVARLYVIGDKTGIVLALRSYLRKASLLGGYMFAGVAVFGSQLDLVFGHAFHFSWLLSLLLAIGWYISAILGPFGYMLSMTGLHRREFAILSFGAILLVVCLYVLIPWLGDVGAALSVAVAFFMVNLIRTLVVIRILTVSPLRIRDLLPPICFTALALSTMTVGASFGRNLILLVAECVGYTILAAVSYLMMFATREEKTWLSRPGMTVMTRTEA